jgi:succinate-semialdehyde dehydrogenase / glutarate-semialdehyde dehydrogenase
MTQLLAATTTPITLNQNADTAITTPTKAFIGGTWQTTDQHFAVHSPRDGAVIAQVADCGPGEATTALEAAVTAFANWRNTTGYERSKVLRAWFERIMANEHELARLMSLEMGKPLAESRGEVHYAASFVEHYAALAMDIAGEMVPNRFSNKRGMVRYEPVGVVYAVTPWNFPAGMITRKAAPALAAGCTVILKPAEQTPLTALLLAQLWQEAGGPAATLQVLPTSNPVALSKVLMEDLRVRKVTFTGSTEVGKLLYAQSAPTVKRISLELGGHAPFLVFEDADVEAAAKAALWAKFRNCGQTCISANRFLVAESVVDAFAQRFAELSSQLRVGDPLDATTQVGPLVDAQGLAKTQDHVDDALAKGATLATGGAALGGLFFQPTVLANVGPTMKIVNEETFGPVAPIISFADEAEAIALANASGYGLAAYVYTRDLSRAFRVTEALEYGLIGLNDAGPSANAPQAPFGGYKQSGLGREGGHWGLDEFLEVKYISLGL